MPRELPPISGKSHFERVLEWLRQEVIRNRILPGAGYAIEQNSRGTALKIRPGKGGGGDGTKPFTRFIIVSVQSEYLLCRDPDSEDLSGSIQVLKPKYLRVPSGNTTVGSYRYASSSDYRFFRSQAQVSDGYIEIQEAVKPFYRAGDPIYASECENGFDDTTEPNLADYIDANIDGRNWFPTYNAFPLCQNDALHYALFAAGPSEAAL